jgi:hypothetical protein
VTPAKSKGNIHAGSTHFSTVSNTSSFPMVEQPQHRTDHSCPSSAGVREMCSYTSTPPYAPMACTWMTLLHLLTNKKILFFFIFFFSQLYRASWHYQSLYLPTDAQ